jgi:hypothetical protein
MALTTNISVEVEAHMPVAQVINEYNLCIDVNFKLYDAICALTLSKRDGP